MLVCGDRVVSRNQDENIVRNVGVMFKVCQVLTYSTKRTAKYLLIVHIN